MLTNALYVALFAPLVASLFSLCFALSSRKIFIGVIASLLLLLSFSTSLILLVATIDGEVIRASLMDWIVIGSIRLDFGFLIDFVSAVMIFVVTLVSTMVHIYAIGYMKQDDGFNRFFVYLSAFVFSMLILVMSDNFVGLFIGWEGVGLCSWLLIGFWYKRESANLAANEAFVMNRMADLGMLLGIFLIFWNFGSLRYEDVFPYVGSLSPLTLNLIAVLLFIGAMGKSAQFPLHTWLANAMEGPTPVSALIHAATMVTAGVYLVVRASPLYSLTPSVSLFIASLGAFVALFAASMALVNRDLKRIIAYSTLSQLGYMFVAAGIGAYWIALFHLMTHAFFKSLLFLGAGNVMHAMDDRLDITKMGGLYRPMKVTAILMILASVALAGIYPFAGFFSKDKILEAAFLGGYPILWGALLLGAVLTAFYSFRLIMLVFFVPKRHEIDHPHEAYTYMLAAMIPLAILAVSSGWIEGAFKEWMIQVIPLQIVQESTPMLHYFLIASALIAALFGLLFALYKYSKGGFSSAWESSRIYRLFYHQYYIPSLYNSLIIVPYMKLSKWAWSRVELRLIDWSVDGVARVIVTAGESLRVVQSGNLSLMIRWISFGVLVLLTSMILAKIGG